jgi:hypothetical protein
VIDIIYYQCANFNEELGVENAQRADSPQLAAWIFNSGKTMEYFS